MANSQKDYFGLNRLISLILCILFGPVLGIVQRILDGHIFCALFRLLTGWNVIWVLDFICLLFSGHILKIF
ncbi:MAG: hypothetical protein KIG91_06175 [Treponema sp.]|nr:hypothetical protein [Treponema sp.]